MFGGRHVEPLLPNITPSLTMTNDGKFLSKSYRNSPIGNVFLFQ